MDKESIYLLQLIHCNCNNCIFMERDFETFDKWKAMHKDLQFREYEQRKELAIREAEANNNPNMVEKAKRMPFQFDASGLINYGNCSKFKKPVSFIPNICQIETQECFKHRSYSVKNY